MAEPRAIRKMAVILAADVVGYSRLVGADEEGTLGRLKDIQRRIVRPRLAQHRGRLVKTTGDGALVEFASVVDALRAAIEIQQDNAHANEGLPDDRRIVFRIGINLGDVVVEGNDLLGDGVNVAARLETLCRPGGVCISRAARDQALGKLPVAFADEGEHQVKNIERPVHVFSVAFDGYVADAGSPVRPPWQQPATIGAAAAFLVVLAVGLAWWRPWASVPPAPAPVAAVQPQAISDRPTVAVLPFTNLSGDPSQEYFSDGISEDLLTALTRFSRLRVIGRNSSFRYNGQSVDLRRIGEELGARYVLEGSVRRDGERVRITAQLIEAANGSHLWAEKYDRLFVDLFAIGDEVVNRVVTAMSVQILATETDRAQRKPPENMDAYDLTLKGRALWTRGDRDSVLESRSVLEQAVQRDPKYAVAHAFLAQSLNSIFNNRWNAEYGSRDAAEHVVAVSSQAYTLDPSDSTVLGSHARSLTVVGRFDEAVALAERAITANPNDAIGLVNAATTFLRAGLPDRVLEVMRLVIEIDPYYPPQYENNFAFAHFQRGNYADAAAAARRCVLRAPNQTNCLANLIAALWESGQQQEARTAARQLIRASPEFIASDEAVRREMAYRDRSANERFIAALRAAGVPEK